ncbi:MAG: hypothetical protein RI897_4235 [Verrucomicrobiota bacterium]
MVPGDYEDNGERLELGVSLDLLEEVAIVGQAEVAFKDGEVESLSFADGAAEAV